MLMDLFIYFCLKLQKNRKPTLKDSPPSKKKKINNNNNNVDANLLIEDTQHLMQIQKV